MVRHLTPHLPSHPCDITSLHHSSSHSQRTNRDGAEFQPTINGWGMNHSDQTWAGDSILWKGATLEAFIESKALWKTELAVEMVRLARAARPNSSQRLFIYRLY